MADKVFYGNFSRLENQSDDFVFRSPKTILSRHDIYHEFYLCITGSVYFDNYIYMTCLNPRCLVKVDPLDFIYKRVGSVENWGLSGGSVDMMGLIIDNNKLISISKDGGLYEIDKETGAATFLSQAVTILAGSKGNYRAAESDDTDYVASLPASIDDSTTLDGYTNLELAGPSYASNLNYAFYGSPEDYAPWAAQVPAIDQQAAYMLIARLKGLIPSGRVLVKIVNGDVSGPFPLEYQAGANSAINQGSVSAARRIASLVFKIGSSATEQVVYDASLIDQVTSMTKHNGEIFITTTESS